MEVGLWHLLWILPTSELVPLAGCGHTESQYIGSLLGKSNRIACFRSCILCVWVPAAASSLHAWVRNLPPGEPSHLRNREMWNRGI